MDITIYLPDAFGKRAKAEGVNLSGMLRAALDEHFREADAMTTALKDAREIKLDLVNDNGEPYTGRLTGSLIAQDRMIEVYLTEDGRVVVHLTDEERVWEPEGDEDLEEQLRTVLDGEAYMDAMRALGIRPVVDL